MGFTRAVDVGLNPGWKPFDVVYTIPLDLTDRLTEAGDDLRYELKKVWRDVTRFVTLDPYELLARVCYYGAFVLDPDGHNIEAVCHDPV